MSEQEVHTKEELSEMTKDELVEHAEEMGAEVDGSQLKDDLIEDVQDAEIAVSTEQEVETLSQEKVDELLEEAKENQDEVKRPVLKEKVKPTYNQAGTNNQVREVIEE